MSYLHYRVRELNEKALQIVSHNTIFTPPDMQMEHDVPCPVCMSSRAVVMRVAPQKNLAVMFQPCGNCQKTGWTTRVISPRTQRVLEFFGLVKHAAPR